MASIEGSLQHSGEVLRVYIPYRRRFVVLALFSCSTALSAFMWICFSPIFSTAQTLFDASSLDINSLSMTYMIAYLPGSVVAATITERYGLRTNLIVAAAANAACAVVRYGGTWWGSPRGSFGVVMFGQLLGALAQPLMLNAPARIANDWFSTKERDIATVVMTMANGIGNAGGAFLPTYLVNEPKDIAWLLLYQAVPALIILVFMVLLVRERPPTPPSAGAEEGLQRRRLEREMCSDHAVMPTLSSVEVRAKEGTAQRVTFRSIAAQLGRDCRVLSKNRNFLLLLTAFSIGAGTSWALLTVLAQLIQPCGYDDTVAGNAGGILLGAGVVMALLMGPVLERTRAYVWLQKAFFGLAVAGTVLVLAVNQPNHSGLLLGAYAVFGVALMPLFPITLEHAAELTFPVPPDNAAAVLLLCANIFSLVLTFILTPLVQLPVSAGCSSIVTPAAGVMLGFMVLAFLVVLPMRKDYRRLEAERLHACAGSPTSGSVVVSASLNPMSTVKATEWATANGTAIRRTSMDLDKGLLQAHVELHGHSRGSSGGVSDGKAAVGHPSTKQGGV